MAKKRSHNGARRNGTHKSGARGRGHSSIGQAWLRDFLSEMLVVEMGGVKLYEKALSELTHSDFQQKLAEFLHQTESHVEICADLLAAAGVDVDYRSPGAKAADHKAHGLISTKVPEKLRDLNNIENLVLAETKDHWNWDMLASVEKKIGDPELKSLVSKAVREVLKQEASHLNWNERTLTTLATEAATKAEFEETEDTERSALED